MRSLSTLIALVASGCSAPGHVMSPEILERVDSSTSAVAYRVAVNWDEVQPKADGVHVLAYGLRVRGSAKPQTDQWRADFVRSLNRLDRYGNLEQFCKKCVPEPGVAIRLASKDKKPIDVLLCFECQMIAFADVGSSDTYGWKNFEPEEEELIRLAKEAFPEDKVIQEMKTR